MPEIKHTSTPWRLFTCGERYTRIVQDSDTNVWWGEEQICNMILNHRKTDTVRDDAKFIVQACNNFDSLLAACERYVAVIKCHCNDMGECITCQGKAAIAAAKETGKF